MKNIKQNKIPIENKYRENRNRSLLLCTLNVRSLKAINRMIELEHSLKNIKFDIIGISEVKITGTAIVERDELIFMYNGEKKGVNGVGFLIKSYLKKSIVDFKTYSDRVCRLDVIINGTILHLIQVYAPTEKAKEKDVDKFYKDLHKALLYTGNDTVIMGDFNSHIGCPLPEENDICGSYGYGKRNERGVTLLSFCQESRFVIMNTVFKKPSKQKWTWKSPDGKTLNEVDFILAKYKNKVYNVEVISTKFSTDHRMLRATYYIKTIKKNRNCFGMKNKNFSLIENKTLQNLMNQKIPNINSTKNIEQCYTSTVQAVKDCISMLATDKEQTKSVIAPETEELIKEREKLKQLCNRTLEQRQRLRKLHKKIQKKIKIRRRNIRLEAIEQELESRSSTKRSRNQFDSKREWVSSLKNSTGKKMTNRKEILNVATDFYTTLYSSTEKQGTLAPSTSEDPIPIFLDCEIKRAILRLKKNKSPGEDRVTTDALIAMIEPLTSHLTLLFNEIITRETLPEDWHTSIITLLYKKGDPHLIDNYRPISLQPTLYKLFSSLILSRILKTLDEQQPREQAGFRKGYSTIDHIFTLTQCIERCNEYNKIIYLAFVDYTKAFDSISHTHLWKSLEEQGIHSKYVNILKNIYNNCSAKIKLETIGPRFEIKRGVKQGDPISPKLFTAILESMFRGLDWQNHGLNINGEQLNHLRFADDIVLIAETHESLQSMINILDKASKEIGLCMNTSKTKAMTNGEQIPIQTDTEIEYVNEYVYLGQTISFQDATSKEIDRRIALSWKKYWMHKDIFKSKIPIRLKKKLMDNTILPSLLYGCQTWALTKNQISKINTFQRATERSMLGIKLRDRVRNVIIREKTKILDATTLLCRLKWKWAGHVARATDGRWGERILHWYPRDSGRDRGRPKRRWKDDIVEAAGSTWTREARDRRTWKHMEEAYTRIWVPNFNEGKE